MGEQNNTENQGKQETPDPQQEPTINSPTCKFRIYPIIALIFIALAEVGIILWQFYDKLLPKFPVAANVVLLFSVFCFGAYGFHNVIKSDEFQKRYSKSISKVWFAYFGFCFVLAIVFVLLSFPERKPNLHLVLYAHTGDSPDDNLYFTNNFLFVKMEKDKFKFPKNLPFLVVDVPKFSPDVVLYFGIENDSAPRFSSSSFDAEKPKIDLWIANPDAGETLKWKVSSQWKQATGDTNFLGEYWVYDFSNPLPVGTGDSATGIRFNSQERISGTSVAVLVSGKGVAPVTYCFKLVVLPSDGTVSKLYFETNAVVSWHWQHRPVSYIPIDSPIVISNARVQLSDGKTAFGSKVDISNPSSDSVYAVTFSVEIENGTVPIGSPNIELSNPDVKDAEKEGLQQIFESSMDIIFPKASLRLFTIPVLAAHKSRSIWIRGTVLTNSFADISIWQSLNSFPEVKYDTKGTWMWPVLSSNSPFWTHTGLEPVNINFHIGMWVGTNGFTNDSQIIPSRP